MTTMTSDDLKEGDEVSWNWGTAHPSGVVAEIKTEGKLEIETKGKQVHKNASPSNPAVHVERQGNDVVKRASELTKESSVDGDHESVSTEAEQGVDLKPEDEKQAEDCAAGDVGEQKKEPSPKDGVVDKAAVTGEKRKRGEEEGEGEVSKDSEGGKKKKPNKKGSKATPTEAGENKKRGQKPGSTAKSKSSGVEKKKTRTNAKNAEEEQQAVEDGGPSTGTRSKD